MWIFFPKPKRKLIALLLRLHHPAESSSCQKLPNCFSHCYEISFTWQSSQFTDLFPETLTRLYTNVFLEQEGRWCCLHVNEGAAWSQISSNWAAAGFSTAEGPPCLLLAGHRHPGKAGPSAYMGWTIEHSSVSSLSFLDALASLRSILHKCIYGIYSIHISMYSCKQKC